MTTDTLGTQSSTFSVPPIGRWPLRGGSACLDFANTVAYRPLGQAIDTLQTYDELLAWGLYAGLVSPAEAERLRQRAVLNRPAAASTFARAVSLREAIYRLFVALARGQETDNGDLGAVKTLLDEGMSHASLVRRGDGFVIRNPEDEADLALPLWRLAESAAQLLLSGDWRRVRECPGHDCGWLFLDTTKNGNRRWCDSADCGNRARVRAHYKRHRAKVIARETGGGG